MVVELSGYEERLLVVEYVSSQERNQILRHYEKRMDESNLAKRTENFWCLLGKAIGPQDSHYWCVALF
jgi:hypothetical protein